MEAYVLGVDFGTDSVRALIVNAQNGEKVSETVIYYPRWRKGLYCNPGKSQFRQHPLDYIESLEKAIKEAIAKAPIGIAEKIKGISIDTTGSTPCAVDENGTPLALTPGFEENPNAMFILWKDHTAIKEAAEINKLAKTWNGEDFTKYEGGVYSSEWFWAKILYILRIDSAVRKKAFSWVEHCDWIPALLVGNTNPLEIKRSRTAAGHKAMWHPSWGGLPPEEFLVKLDPLLKGLRNRLFTETYTADVKIGKLSDEWAKRLGLSTNVTVGVGSFDAHLGAIGGQIELGMLVKVMGTSTCDMLISEIPSEGEHLVKGICGQVNGSILPNVLGLEAGQSALGDVYAWFKEVISWPLKNILAGNALLEEEKKQRLIEETVDKIIPKLSEEAAKLPVNENDIIALDWFNGRRTPYANQNLRGAIANLNLSSDAPRIFKSLVEATAFGARKIVDRFREEGVGIKGVIAIGGIPKKSPYIMQVTADVLNMPIKVVASDQAVALGAAMAAATVAGIYDSLQEAQKHMGSGFECEYHPRKELVPKYEKLYQRYLQLADFVEHQFTLAEHEIE